MKDVVAIIAVKKNFKMLKNKLYFFNPNNLFKKGRHLTFIEKKINKNKEKIIHYSYQSCYPHAGAGKRIQF